MLAGITMEFCNLGLRLHAWTAPHDEPCTCISRMVQVYCLLTTHYAYLTLSCRKPIQSGMLLFGSIRHKYALTMAAYTETHARKCQTACKGHTKGYVSQSLFSSSQHILPTIIATKHTSIALCWSLATLLRWSGMMRYPIPKLTRTRIPYPWMNISYWSNMA